MQRLKLWISSSTAALFVLAMNGAAFATSTSGGNGASVGFVQPIKNFANALELVGGSLIIISLVTVVVQHAMHREDWGGLMKSLVYMIIAGFVILSAGTFVNQVGLTGTLLK